MRFFILFLYIVYSFYEKIKIKIKFIYIRIKLIILCHLISIIKESH